MIEPRVEFVNFNIIGDERGSLISLENSHNIGFDIKRMYYIYGTQKNISRGFHAHKKLKQLLIAVSGTVDIYCEYQNVKQTFSLNSPSIGLIIEGPVWRIMQNFSEDSVLIVLADGFYDENDYIREYDHFLCETQKGYKNA
ncbi:FdtA/QdtA family cupin domain-containing protein [Gilliamella sp. W8126]|uniref:dTDP-6-deoxy-3,4-keto-hexulose isomerase n=1 Tax=Gilliamella apis TaxID=1970738 RepID=A0A2V4DN90_9GAMM|nr:MULTISPECIES: FdtA/QdtA family cupin domain-containing protein [Gilliamella]MBI0005852.1 FdtA/QdtA family cupin domain-containing protein [Gilliamella sp. W8126]PXY91520.1 dTDP-6-deoxy-3,4-keto-hexulose isomerase [Gilliamella apis]WLS93487.1 FdtA/QdtA family cupin domain-containing protein [Gilliamella apis]WLT06065.1 FdtA/QdtA family cupin domain-containing protein [Gilliamella apis]